MKRASPVKSMFLHAISVFALALGAAAFAAEENKMNGPTAASRAAPAQIPPIEKNGVRYTNTPDTMDFVTATDLKSGEKRWTQRVLNYWQNPRDPHEGAIYFQSMRLTDHDSKLLIKDEGQTSYLLDLKTREVSILEWPVRLQIVGWAPSEKNWSYRVKFQIHNALARVLKVDEPSVAFGGKPGAPGELSGDLFYEVVVELGEAYPIPNGAHDVTIAFEHRNHFSPDGFVMKSPVSKFRLDGTWEAPQKSTTF